MFAMKLQKKFIQYKLYKHSISKVQFNVDAELFISNKILGNVFKHKNGAV
jgi:hypothetical protein